MLTMFWCSSKIMARLDVVPWSRAMTYLLMRYAPFRRAQSAAVTEILILYSGTASWPPVTLRAGS